MTEIVLLVASGAIPSGIPCPPTTLLLDLLQVAYLVLCGRKRLLRFRFSGRHTRRNVFGVYPSCTQTVCPLCVQVFSVRMELVDM